MAPSASSPVSRVLTDGTLESITTLLAQANQGHAQAWDRIYALLYQDLHKIARAHLKPKRRGLPMSATSLVNEGWLTLVNSLASAKDRQHLLALMARAMRYVVLDGIKWETAAKRGADAVHVSSEAEMEQLIEAPRGEKLVLLGQVLEQLEKIDPRMATIAELRYFGGLNDIEIGALLQMADHTVRREWQAARAFLLGLIGPVE